MPARELQEKLDSLREQLDKNAPLSDTERHDLNELTQKVEAQIKLDNATQNTSLSDEVNLAVERFEVEHPALAGALRNIVQTLGNIGI
ncbi:DUF4404 family protein [Pseudomonas sp. NPDC096917]|uniref:DUF4404 family protein n=1 Tax=Pseudomonas sp. NPDC096917 TaxID=3364483 RepID=UPI00383AB6B6